MARIKPLFPQESIRTRQFRKVIIRKTLQIVRQHPTWADDDICALVEAEAISLCDMCVESSFNDGASPGMEHYFLADARDQRQDHVGRFFVYKMERQLRSDHITNNLIPIFSESVASLLGHDTYEEYSKRLKDLIDGMTDKGMTYPEIIKSEPAQRFIQEVVDAYKHELLKTSSFEDLLKNKLDAELARYQTDNLDKSIDIVEAVNSIYRNFLTTIGLVSPKDSGNEIK